MRTADANIHPSAVLLLVLNLVAFLITGCSSTVTNESVARPVEVFEIRADAKGLQSAVGNSLFFRLNEDGSAEFEIPKEIGRSADISRAEEVNVFRKISLPFDERERLIGKLRAIKDSPFEPMYQKCCCTDSEIDFYFLFEKGGSRQSVSILGSCTISDVLKEEAGKRFAPWLPEQFLDLFRTVDNLRWKYRKESN